MSGEQAVARSRLSVIATLLRPFRRTARKPVILISGMARVGKTRLARKIAEHTGFGVIHTDRLRTTFWEAENMDERAAQRRRAYAEALAARRHGIVLEGVDLVLRNQGAPARVKNGDIKQDMTPSLDLITHLSQQFQANAFIVGCADADPGEKELAIRRHDSAENWTGRFSDIDMKRLVSNIVAGSRTLRKAAEESRVDYIELPAELWEEHIALAAQHVLAVVRRR